MKLIGIECGSWDEPDRVIATDPILVWPLISAPLPLKERFLNYGPKGKNPTNPYLGKSVEQYMAWENEKRSDTGNQNALLAIIPRKIWDERGDDFIEYTDGSRTSAPSA